MQYLPKLWVRSALLCASVLIVTSCKHGVDIKGQGRVVSLTGSHSCEKAEAPCRFDVIGAYSETYTAIASAGWLHDSWELCGNGATGKTCTFNIDAASVKKFEGKSIPSVTARFRRPIEPLFPITNGIAQLPDTAAARQFKWIMGELTLSSTSLSTIRDHFSTDEYTASEFQSMLQSIRSSIPNAKTIAMVAATPNVVQAIIGNPNDAENGSWIEVFTGYGPDGQIIELDIYPATDYFEGSGPGYSNLSLQGLTSKFSTLANTSGLLVARIDNDSCKPLAQYKAKDPQPAGSMFNLWVMGALDQAIDDGRIAATAMVPLSADELVDIGETINTEPLGTQFPLSELAALMMAGDDPTASEHIHKLVGRNHIEKTVKQFKHKNSALMYPVLSWNEQLHLLGSVTPQQANDFAAASETSQREFANSTLEPLGSSSGFNARNKEVYFNHTGQASPFDICAAIAGMRKFDNRSEAFRLLDQAMGARAGFFGGTFDPWDRVWVTLGVHGVTDETLSALNISVLVESDARGAYVVALMLNDENGINFEGTLVGEVEHVVTRAVEIISEGL